VLSFSTPRSPLKVVENPSGFWGKLGGKPVRKPNPIVENFLGINALCITPYLFHTFSTGLKPT
jgi:hypothetical protein